MSAHSCGQLVTKTATKGVSLRETPFVGAPSVRWASSTASSRSMSSACASRSFTRASASPYQHARSTSGNSCNCPDRGGHSSKNVLLAESGRVEVALCAPGGDDLAGLLADRAEIDERLPHDRRRRAELLLELAQRNLERLLARLDLALRDRPGRRRPSARRTARPDGRAAPRRRHCRGGRGEGRRCAWASRSQPT